MTDRNDERRLRPKALDRALTLALTLGATATVVGSTALRLITDAGTLPSDDESDLDLVWTHPSTTMLDDARRTFGGDAQTWLPKALPLGHTAYECGALNGRCAVEIAEANSWTALSAPVAIA